jgi:hypothetical protein
MNYRRHIVNIIMRWAGHAASMGDISNVYKMLVRKSEEKKLPRRPRQRWKYSNRMDLREIGWELSDRIHLGDWDQWQAVVNTVVSCRVP